MLGGRLSIFYDDLDRCAFYILFINIDVKFGAGIFGISY